MTLSSVTLVLRLGQRNTTGPLFVDPATLRQRAEVELERALRYFRPFCVLHVALGAKAADRPRVELALQAVCRSLDMAWWSGADSFCVVLPELEPELFGHEKGAFTHATSTKTGRFEAASGGTLFLDEVGELSLAIQAKLLRALDTQRITRLGDVNNLIANAGAAGVLMGAVGLARGGVPGMLEALEASQSFDGALDAASTPGKTE